VAFLGDSASWVVSWSLGTYLPPQRQFEISVRSVPGCGSHAGWPGQAGDRARGV